jgi:uncharacterized protein YprB with RNaseH-like and TPR domain
MLTKSFCHLPGIGIKKERAIWARGITSWRDFARESKREATDANPADGHQELTQLVEESAARLDAGDPAWFERTLPSTELWRLFPEFRHTAAYLDIETNGQAGHRGYITTISLFDGQKVRTYAKGRNLNDFARDIFDYRLLITYNGRCFDVPFIEECLRIKLDHAHIDLMYIMRSLGFKGGLKGSEKALGIDRGELDGVDGFFAVLLWREYRRTGLEAALETLLAYNVLDAVNLERLMVEAYNLKIEATPFASDLRIELPPTPESPYAPDPATMGRVLRSYQSFRS